MKSILFLIVSTFFISQFCNAQSAAIYLCNNCTYKISNGQTITLNQDGSIKKNGKIAVDYRCENIDGTVSIYFKDKLVDELEWQSEGNCTLKDRKKLCYTLISCKPNDQNIDSKSAFFSGTKKFCDEGEYWYYLVTIKENKIVLKSYPGKNNTYHKNKKVPKEIINGSIKDGNIITKDSPEYLKNRFRFENGVLLEINNEGGDNVYSECK